MPAKSPEAVARKNARLRAKRANAKIAAKAAAGVVLSKTDPVYRRSLPPVLDPVETPANRRAFLEQVFRNTAGMSA